jgi:uncharacterized membrane protein YbhN (UPF0104 family)
MTVTLTAPPRLARRSWWRPALLVAGVALAVVELRGHLPSAASTWTALRQAHFGWLVAAVVLEVASMTAFAEQQRHLLASFGVRMSSAVSMSIGYARSAMSTALPGGSAVSAAYAFRQFRAEGASQPVAAAVMLLSGVASVVGLALLSAGDAALTWISPTVLVAVSVAAVVAVIAARRPVVAGVAPVAGGSPMVGSSVVGSSVAGSPVVGSSIAGSPVVGSAPGADARPAARLRATVRHTAAMARSVPARRWLGVIALAVVNWTTDLACLVAAAYAVGLTVPAAAIVVAYLAAQLVRQIPITPGGIGVIEASLGLALTTAGAAAAPAAAAVLVYRLISCWVLLPIGLVCWTARKSASAEPAHAG